MKMITTINHKTGAFSHPFFAPTVEEAIAAMTKINPENMDDLHFHPICEIKDNSDLFRLTLGPTNPTSKQHLNQLIADCENAILNYEDLITSDLNDETTPYINNLRLEYKLAAVKYDLAKYYLDMETIYDNLSDL